MFQTIATLLDVQFYLGSSFQPSVFTCSAPVPTKTTAYHGGETLRYSTRQRAYGFITATVRMRGAEAYLGTWTHTITDKDSCRYYNVDLGYAPLPIQLRPLWLSERQFGVELELSSDMDPQEVAQQIRSATVTVPGYTHEPSRTDWKLVPDSSIVCNLSLPNCQKFELVSPILKSGVGLSQFNNVLKDLSASQGMIQVNESMGFHVHVDVSDLTLDQLIKVCQNFVKYEHVMDTFVPSARRSHSSASQLYFRTHQGIGNINRDRIDRLAACQTIEQLARTMSPNRYAKLNMHNLVTARQPTVEFRQHHATTDYTVLSSWIRFCVRFVENSARYRAPQAPAEHRSNAQARDYLFVYVIKDRGLADFFTKLQGEVEGECCQRCATGQGCRIHQNHIPSY